MTSAITTLLPLYGRPLSYILPMVEALQRNSRHGITMDPPQVARISWAMSVQVCKDVPLRKALAVHAHPLATEFAPPDLSSTCWAFSKVHCHDTTPLLVVFAARAASMAQDLAL